MKIAFPIDGLLCDTEALKTEWFRRFGDTRFLSDAVFWAALTPYEDAFELVEFLSQFDFYVMAERPKALYLPSRAWIRKHFGIHLTKDRLIMQAIKRYDCRLRGIGAFVDSDGEAIENLKVETVCPITPYYVDRTQEGAVQKVIREINEDIRNNT